MASGARTRSTVSRVRRVLSALAVLTGLLALHGLSPSGMPAAGQHVMAAPTALAGHHTAAAPVTDRAPLASPWHGGTAMDHAGTCAAGGTAASYLPPALSPSPTPCGEPAEAALRHRIAGTPHGRAPPDLSELQLLRI
ncbi:DUF6153 family protein [Streptomyces sp. NPDC048664]|uniref:DUF6153 family protein n=1 Tax=Streptomyces sp. NPDC048664 TaxID=3154505 RepID=UPI00341BD34C